MGNVNGREEDGEGGVGGGEEEDVRNGGVLGSSAAVDSVDEHRRRGGNGSGVMVVPHGGGGSVVYRPPHPELMGHSPPHSPRATHSPLMFTPQQVPVVPLPRPDEVQIPSDSWMQSSGGYEETVQEQGIPTMITWSYGGKDVAVEGSWDNWKSRKLARTSLL
ncbi:SNF1-related protein kinase regulatory subunit beta-2 [Linum perenne]